MRYSILTVDNDDPIYENMTESETIKIWKKKFHYNVDSLTHYIKGEDKEVYEVILDPDPDCECLERRDIVL